MPDLKSILKAGFPFISAGLAAGGPIGNMAASALGSALGVGKPNPSQEEISAQLSKGLTPDQVVALQKAEQDFKLSMEKLGYQHIEQLEAIAEKDRESARNREIVSKDSWTPRILAFSVAFLWGSVTWYLLRNVIPTQMREIVMRSLGTLDMALGLVLSYYFGSSRGSADKDQTIANLSK